MTLIGGCYVTSLASQHAVHVTYCTQLSTSASFLLKYKVNKNNKTQHTSSQYIENTSLWLNVTTL